MSSNHLVLAGDSIFDNDGYVPSEPGVIAQVRALLPNGWKATKIAVDGDIIEDVVEQLNERPSDMSHLVVSVGGNNALSYSDLIAKVQSPDDLPALMTGPLAEYEAAYAALIDILSKLKVQVTVCTIYTHVPFENPLWRQYVPKALVRFNEVILKQAARARIPVLRLDEICQDESDYSVMSPIEPSAKGGQKIAEGIIASIVEGA